MNFVNPKLKELRKKAMALPLQPGVYIMKNKKKEIIYIGKAKALKNRVSQYFGSQNNHPEKVLKMVSNVDDFEYIITDSEFESLILECSLIKLHQPKYNILLKDDKGYSYIKISDEEYRRISYVLQKDDDNATYLGPYKSSFYVKNSVEEAQKIFMLPTCNRKFPQDFGKARPCLNFHIKQCCAPCTGRVKKSEYNERVDSAIEFLKGGSSSAIKKLNEQMIEASNKEQFENAAKYRDRIKAIKKMRDKQKVVDINIKELDVITLAVENKRGCFEVFRFQDSSLVDRESFVINDAVDDLDERSEFITRYYSIRSDIPKVILLDKELEDTKVIEKWLSEQRNNRVYINVPKRGVYKKLIDMCKQNALEILAQEKGFTGKQLSVLEKLKTLLSLDSIPEYIESYDISNMAGKDNVAGMIVYENARPLKSAYKKFKIKSFEGQDDYSSMKEVLKRRIEEYRKGKDKGFSRLPDLILLDGGKGQVSAVKEVLSTEKINIPVFGMVKDDKHRTRAITTEKEEIQIRSDRQMFNFITGIQDEVHRFAISFHQKRRSKSISTTLVKIDGIGENRAKSLLKYFRTIANIKEASVEELEKAPLMTHDSAVNVYMFFKNED